MYMASSCKRTLGSPDLVAHGTLSTWIGDEHMAAEHVLSHFPTVCLHVHDKRLQADPGEPRFHDRGMVQAISHRSRTRQGALGTAHGTFVLGFVHLYTL